MDHPDITFVICWNINYLTEVVYPGQDGIPNFCTFWTLFAGGNDGWTSHTSFSAVKKRKRRKKNLIVLGFKHHSEP